VEYFDLVPDGSVLELMVERLDATPSRLRAIPEDRLTTPHRPGEWTVNDIVQHISDDERIYTYRALRFARGDGMELPGFDPDEYAALTDANSRRLDDLIDEFLTVRKATVSFFDGLPDAALTRIGTANGAPMSVRAAAFHILGHELHHLVSIDEHYGPSSA
jgi:uncharacterized damage-inducible protein DinB